MYGLNEIAKQNAEEILRVKKVNGILEQENETLRQRISVLEEELKTAYLKISNMNRTTIL